MVAVLVSTVGRTRAVRGRKLGGAVYWLDVAIKGEVGRDRCRDQVDAGIQRVSC